MSSLNGLVASSRLSRVEGLPTFVSWELASCEPDKSLRDRRRRSYVLGRTAAYRAMAKADFPSSRIPVGDGGAPVWPSGVTGSISHTHTHGFAMVAESDLSDGIGVDIELVRAVPEIAGLVARPEEMEWLQRSSDPEEALLRLFSAKECIFKAFYPRVRTWIGFEAASLRPAEGGFEGRLVQSLDPDYPYDRTFFVRSHVSDTHLCSWLVLPKTVS